MIELVKALVYSLAALSAGLFVFFWAARSSAVGSVKAVLLRALVLSQAAIFLSPNLLVLNILLVVIVLALCRKRAMIAPVYLFLVLTLPMVGNYLELGGLYITVYNASIVVGLGALIALGITRGHGVSRRVAYDLPVLIFLLLTFAATVRGASATNMLRIATDLLVNIALPYLIVSRSVRSAGEIRIALIGIIAATAVLSSLAIFEAFRSWPLYRVVWSHYGVSMVATANVKMRGGLLRSAGPYPEPTSFAFALTLGTLAAIAARSAFRDNTRHLWLVLLLLVGGFMPNSRGAVAGLVIGTVVLLAYQKRNALLGKVLAAGAVGGAVVLGVAQASQQFASVAGLDAGGQGTIDYRSRLWNRGLEEIQAHPVFGAASSDVVMRLHDLVQGEGVVDFVNVYIYIGLVSGLVGLCVFVAALLLPLLTLGQARRRLLPAPDLLGAGAWVVGGLAALMTMIAFTSMTGRNETMLIVLFAFGAAVLNEARLVGRRRPLPASPQRQAGPTSKDVFAPA